MSVTKTSEDFLTAIADCPSCLSKRTLFHRFSGELIQSDKTKPAEGICILSEVHKCLDCKHEFEKHDGPWIGFELAVWHQAMRHGLQFVDVLDYTNYIRREREG